MLMTWKISSIFSTVIARNTGDACPTRQIFAIYVAFEMKCSSEVKFELLSSYDV